MSLSAPIYKLKRKAKLLSREADITLTQALDRVAIDEGFQSWSLLAKRHSEKKEHVRQYKNTTASSAQITSLPLRKEDRAEFIEAANSVFESVMDRIEPEHPDATRSLWDAGEYVDGMLAEDMLPISRDYALSMIDAFLVHHVIALATQADKQFEVQ